MVLVSTLMPRSPGDGGEEAQFSAGVGTQTSHGALPSWSVGSLGLGASLSLSPAGSSHLCFRKSFPVPAKPRGHQAVLCTDICLSGRTLVLLDCSRTLRGQARWTLLL